jgi:hypothetical protein
VVERREFRRHRVGGNVEITNVLGAGTIPDERATVLDCSLGGARLRVPSPARRLFRAAPPCLSPRDSVTCTLRLAPHYDQIEVMAEVVRVKRLDEEPDVLDVGLRFFHDPSRRSHNERPMARLARLLEPNRSEEEAALLAKEATTAPSAAAPKPSARIGQRVPKPVAEAAPESAKRASARVAVVQSASARQERAKSARLERPKSARLERPASGRLDRLAGERPAKKARPALSSDSEVVAWASARLAAPTWNASRVATAADEVCVRGSGRLVAGEAIIELPGAFTATVREAGLTAHVTPTEACAGLYISERTPARLVVRELANGKSAASFDYLVVAPRRV